MTQSSLASSQPDRTDGQGPGAADAPDALARPAAKPLQRVVLFGAFGPPALAFVRSCARNGIAVHLLERVAAGEGPSGRSSALAGQEALPVGSARDDAVVDAIKSYCDRVAAQALIAVSEADLLWLAGRRRRFEPAVKLLTASEACLKRIQSKNEQIALAREAGFDLLPTWPLQSAADCDAIPADQYPVCLRPSNPGDVEPSFKAQIHHEPATLRAALERLTRIDAPIIAQPFLKLPDLKVHGARAETGEIVAMQPFLVERKFEGVTLTLSRASFPPGVEAACRRFAELAGIAGAFHYDLLYDPARGKAYYLEINVRMGGITDKARAFGYDQPGRILECFGFGRDGWIAPTPTTRRRVVTKRAILKHVLVVARGRHSELDYPQVSPLRHILLSCRDLLFARDSVFDWGDLKGTLWFNLQ